MNDVPKRAPTYLELQRRMKDLEMIVWLMAASAPSGTISISKELVRMYDPTKAGITTEHSDAAIVVRAIEKETKKDG